MATNHVMPLPTFDPLAPPLCPLAPLYAPIVSTSTPYALLVLPYALSTHFMPLVHKVKGDMGEYKGLLCTPCGPLVPLTFLLCSLASPCTSITPSGASMYSSCTLCWCNRNTGVYTSTRGCKGHKRGARTTRNTQGCKSTIMGRKVLPCTPLMFPFTPLVFLMPPVAPLHPLVYMWDKGYGEDKGM